MMNAASSRQFESVTFWAMDRSSHEGYVGDVSSSGSYSTFLASPGNLTPSNPCLTHNTGRRRTIRKWIKAGNEGTTCCGDAMARGPYLTSATLACYSGVYQVSRAPAVAWYFATLPGTTARRP